MHEAQPLPSARQKKSNAGVGGGVGGMGVGGVGGAGVGVAGVGVGFGVGGGVGVDGVGVGGVGGGVGPGAGGAPTQAATASVHELSGSAEASHSPTPPNALPYFDWIGSTTAHALVP